MRAHSSCDGRMPYYYFERCDCHDANQNLPSLILCGLRRCGTCKYIAMPPVPSLTSLLLAIRRLPEHEEEAHLDRWSKFEVGSHY